MEELRMSLKERDRQDVMSRVKRGELTVVEASGLLRISLRQARRVWKGFQADGVAGLVHGLRGRVSNRRFPEEFRQRVLKRQQERYADFGPTFACEKLAEEGMVLSPDSLVAFLKERHLWVRRRRHGKHRRRRERRASFGSMVQMDGSHHDWFEGRAGKCVLMVIIDDASNRTYARLYPAETTEAAFDVFGRWVKAQGFPRAVYVDRHGIYRDEEHPEKPTQFGRAMKELGVELIRAHSPQAKGRVERRNAVFQDRLVKEMRLRNISDMKQANAFLEEKFLGEMNGRYSVKARRQTDLHRPVGPEVVLEEILCVQEQRVVGQDWCVRWHNRWLQIAASHGALALAGRRVLVKHRADGQVVLEYQGRRLEYQFFGSRPAPAKPKRTVINNVSWKPPADHPWKAGLIERFFPRVSPAPAAPARDLHAGRMKTG
jgi:transposase-like protein